MTSDYFPGSCPLPVDSAKIYSVKINASMPTDWGKPTAFSKTSARRPTGYYLPAGCIGTITVPD